MNWKWNPETPPEFAVGDRVLLYSTWRPGSIWVRVDIIQGDEGNDVAGSDAQSSRFKDIDPRRVIDFRRENVFDVRPKPPAEN